ncbi:MAG: bifunctional (p)ppGpp synthetase/guanosine-3',5'-bis(diphosphate) 3'-pyrophosphohydrolase [Chloroflexi bacterium]|nr:bifunctional (p)ppGpp synthetase/guanosine-3',5'-bis(diphosphate) 3'-pyrophosphohydrolase [Chloroflexota bacterium]
MKFESLVESLPADIPPNDRALIERAYRRAEQAHHGQTRKSGEPYIQHCLAVAQILAEMRMPPAAISAGLLHDTVEDTGLTLDDLRKEFGDEVAALVDGVTKLDQLPRVSGGDGRTRAPDKNAETLRKTFLAMGEDVRVILIKLADRLHNMRTLNHLEPEKQQRIAKETLEIFAPLANRLGIWQIKWELEDRSFQVTQPDKYREIAAALAERRGDRERTMAKIVETLERKLAEHSITAEVSGRPKHIYSIWKKMDRKEVSLDQVYDLRAVRVLVKDMSTCYIALGVVHNLWKPIPGEIDDYIATPKDNFYQSLHTAVVYDDGKTLEVQIRTSEMHENAEYGIAAHWMYKEGMPQDKAYEARVNWLRRLMEWRQDVTDAPDFVESLKSDVFRERVYAFTPRGDIIDLPAGATAVDFAYHVHTSVGDRCRGAKVNGRLVPLNTTLRTGDQVEILTAKRGGPSRDWLNDELGFVKSARAKQKIKSWFKKQDREQNLAVGRDLIDRELKRLGIEKIGHEAIAELFGYQKVESFLEAIGCGDIGLGQIGARLDEAEREGRSPVEILPQAGKLKAAMSSQEINVLGTRGLLTTLARCCTPAPGDDIVGFLTRGRGVTVHRRDCPNALNTREKERLIRVSWGQAAQSYPVSVRINAYDREGLMRDISTLVADEHVNMSAVSVTTKNNIATLLVTMDVTDVAQLSRLLARIEQLPNVLEAHRWKAG